MRLPPLGGRLHSRQNFKPIFNDGLQKKLYMKLRNDFPYFISTLLLDLKKLLQNSCFWSVLDCAPTKTSQSTLWHDFPIPIS